MRYHICWGSWHGPHSNDVPLKDIVDLVLQVKAQAYLFEAANVRHEHEYHVWDDVKLPEGKILIPGVVSHATNVLEHPELVAERLRRFVDRVGQENVMGGTDCGLGGRVHPQLVWAKLQALAEGAALATGASASPERGLTSFILTRHPMKRSTDRILTTLAGSLIRPALGHRPDTRDRRGDAHRDAAIGRRRGRAQAGRGRRRRRQRRRVRQVELVHVRHGAPGGLRGAPVEPPEIGFLGRDEKRFRDFFAARDQRRSSRSGSVRRPHPLHRQAASCSATSTTFSSCAQGRANVEEAFLPVVAPTSISVNHTNEYYKSQEEYLFAVADALHEEYKIITDAGLIVQLDDAILTHFYDRITDEGSDYRKWVAQNVEVINHALRGIPEEQVRYHLCWGSWPARTPATCRCARSST